MTDSEMLPIMIMIIAFVISAMSLKKNDKQSPSRHPAATVRRLFSTTEMESHCERHLFLPSLYHRLILMSARLRAGVFFYMLSATTPAIISIALAISFSSMAGRFFPPTCSGMKGTWTKRPFFTACKSM